MPPNITLKQRLAALSSAPSAPSSPRSQQQSQYLTVASPATDQDLSSPILKSPRRKGFNVNNFTPPWAKKSLVIANAEIRGSALIQETMDKLIFQAGVDYETRPMVVISASALPDPREINYDLLLSQVLSYLNLYVEADYTVVFLAAGGKHSPGWNWVWKAYRSLSRKYRKNLKRLYVVHSTFFTKMLFSLAGAIISPKFFRKITYLDTLSELAHHVPLTQIDIPPAVYQENLKREQKITLPIPTSSSTFGVPLQDIMGYEGEKGGIPRVVKDATQFLRDTGLGQEGLFRRSPSSAMLRAAQEAYDRGNVVSLETFGDPHLAAVLLKKYLRDLPTPIFEETMYPAIKRCPMPTSDPGDMASVMYIREMLLTELAPCTYILLSHILHLMHEVSLRSASNRMDAHNLAVVLCPNLVSGSNPVRDVLVCAVPGGPALFQQQPPQLSSSISPSLSSPNPASPASPLPSPSNKAALVENKTTLGAVIKLCIQRYYEIFDEIVDRGEPVGVYPGHEYASEMDHTPGGTPEISRDVSAEPSDDEHERGHREVQHRQKRAWTGNGGFKGLGSRSGHPVPGEENNDVPSLSVSSSAGLRPEFHRRQSSGLDDEDIDDAMLVMPIGPEHEPQPSGPGLPNAWANGGGDAGGGPGSGAGSTFKPRHQHRSTLSNGSRTKGVSRSINTDYGAPPSSFSLSQSVSYATYSKGKARSMISVDSGSGSGPAVRTIGPGKKGSISIGRGTNKNGKGSGSGVAAMGITAEGFFAPPPVPPLPGNFGKGADGGVVEAGGGGEV